MSLRTPRFPRIHICLALVVSILAPSRALAQVPDTTFWVANSTVDAMTVSGNTLYLGGSFTEIGPSTGGGVALNPANGAVLTSFPKVHGWVYAVVSDGAGGWFIGGEFIAVGGTPRANLAHILSDHSVGPWNPGANRRVNDLLVLGNKLYVGGFFTTIGGQARSCIAAVDASTGVVAAWNPNASSEVNAIVTRGTTIYAAGRFLSIGGQPRNYLAEVDTVTGAATAWNPNPNGEVTTIEASGSVIYAAGGISQIGGQIRPYVGAVSALSGLATSWNPRPNGNVLAIVAKGNLVYLGGGFTEIIANSQPRARLAATDSTTGAATSWNPGIAGGFNNNPLVRVLTVDGSTVYAGGDFSSLGGQPRVNLGAVSATTGLAQAFDPHAGSTVRAVAVGAGVVYAGGTFPCMNGLSRNRLAALNATTGKPLAWNPNCNGPVYDLAVQSGVVYAVGAFSSVGGLTRYSAAAIDATSGAVTAWNPGTQSGVSIHAVTAIPSSIFVGGDFTQMAGLPRSRIAALSPATGQALAWDPNPSGAGTLVIRDLGVSGSRLYAGGSFNYIGGLARNHLAALDTLTGQAVFTWNPDPDLSVLALAVDNSAVYVAGVFANIGGQPRNRLAALDPGSGLATGWNPNVSGSVGELVATSGLVCAIGQFTAIGGQARIGFAAFTRSTGQLLPEYVDPTFVTYGYSVNGVAISGARVFVGGQFTLINGQPASGLASFVLSSVADVPPGEAPHAMTAWPNPSRRDVSIQFSLPAATTISLEVLDLAGRLVWRSPDAHLGAGSQSMSWAGQRSDLNAANEGVYFLRIVGRDFTATRRIVRLN